MSGSVFLGIFSAAGCMQTLFLLFYMFNNLFHHTPWMISDSFLATRWATFGAMRIQSVTAATEQPDYHALADILVTGISITYSHIRLYTYGINNELHKQQY